jgi:PleD family two-component response regulator
VALILLLEQANAWERRLEMAGTATGDQEEAMQTSPDVMIIDTDRKRIKALRRILRDARRNVAIEEITEVKRVKEAIVTRRPTLVLLHSTFPYLEEDGTGLMELIQEDFRNANIGVMLVLPISGSVLYRSGYQEGMEILDMADDLITTDFTNDMIQAVTLDYLDRRAAVAEAVEAEPEAAAEPGYAFISKSV